MTDASIAAMTREGHDLRNEARVIVWLDRLGLSYRLFHHPPVQTVADAQRVRTDQVMPGGHYKTLFVRDKKGAEALVVVDEHTSTDLQALAGLLAMKRLSFASPDRLWHRLRVLPGSVTPLAVINARVRDGQDARFRLVLDRSLFDHDRVHFHPLHNAATIGLAPQDLVSLTLCAGYAPTILAIPARQ